ncbi:MAG: acyl-CoA dehydrogenase family protein [Pseudomonadota bacterium]|nr:acyl-CoA dehydrogenase family protein [Pseudomonadota bacterium]
MSMVLNEEQSATQAAAKKLIQARSPVLALRKLRDEKADRGFDESLWQQMVELGWAGILIPEEYGGLGLSPGYLSVVLEECGRTLAASPLWSSSVFATYLLVNCVDSAIRRDTLAALAAGQCQVAVALEERARHAPYDIDTVLSAGEHSTLTGRKHFVVNGHVANKFIVSCRDAHNQLRLVLVDAAHKAVRVERNWMVDSHNSATVYFDNVAITSEQILGSADTVQLFDSALDVARLGLAAEMLGSASEAFERTLAYLKEREQFGVIIGSFQGLKHRAANMFVELELARSCVRAGFSYLDEGGSDATQLAKLASIAKMQLSQTLNLVSNESVQMHAGIGMTDEHEIGFFLKRARVLEQLLGDDVFHVDRYADLHQY